MSTAQEIVKAVGGPGNIQSLTHCATRLRFQLIDSSGVKVEEVESIKGVMGAVPQAGNRFQVIMGGAVQNAYNDINALPEMANVGQPSDEEIKAAARAVVSVASSPGWTRSSSFSRTLSAPSWELCSAPRYSSPLCR